MKTLEGNLARVMPEPTLLRVSARTGEDVDRRLKWLGARRLALKAGAAASPRVIGTAELDSGASDEVVGKMVTQASVDFLSRDSTGSSADF